MREHERPPAPRSVPARAPGRRRPPAEPPGVARVLALQRMVGNTATRDLLGRDDAGAGLLDAAERGEPPGDRPRSHHYVKRFEMGTFPRSAFPTVGDAARIFKADFLCARLGPPGSETVLTPSLPLFGSNHVKNVAETETADDWQVTLATVPGKHILKGTAEHRIRLVPVGDDRVQVVWEVEGRGPAEGESLGQRAVQAIGAFGAFSVWQRWVFGRNLRAHAARAAKAD